VAAALLQVQEAGQMVAQAELVHGVALVVVVCQLFIEERRLLLSLVVAEVQVIVVVVQVAAALAAGPMVVQDWLVQPLEILLVAEEQLRLEVQRVQVRVRQYLPQV
jgi:hypothetical protein